MKLPGVLLSHIKCDDKKKDLFIYLLLLLLQYTYKI